mmetsp:Transcript_24097/g.82415  ORF Transcript_24097/g.82415 Transcript_24097/m.82415 type:complete len:222 (-) Transcript_24097:1207-1872(-)
MSTLRPVAAGLASSSNPPRISSSAPSPNNSTMSCSCIWFTPSARAGSAYARRAPRGRRASPSSSPRSSSIKSSKLSSSKYSSPTAAARRCGLARAASARRPAARFAAAPSSSSSSKSLFSNSFADAAVTSTRARLTGWSSSSATPRFSRTRSKSSSSSSAARFFFFSLENFLRGASSSSSSESSSPRSSSSPSFSLSDTIKPSFSYAFFASSPSSPSSSSP